MSKFQKLYESVMKKIKSEDLEGPEMEGKEENYIKEYKCKDGIHKVVIEDHGEDYEEGQYEVEVYKKTSEEVDEEESWEVMKDEDGKKMEFYFSDLDEAKEKFKEMKEKLQEMMAEKPE